MDYKHEYKHEIKHNAPSIHSIASTASTLLDTPEADFLEGKRFHIEARGIRAFRPPMPMRQNEVPIYDANGALAYTATKDKTWSSHSVLSSPKHGELFSIDFTPGSRPWIRFLQPVEGDVVHPIALDGKWTSRTMSFTPPEGGCRWEWKYTRTTTPDKKDLKALCLEKVELSESGEKATRVAHLLRSPDTRATGSSCCSAGNGGQLVISSGSGLSLVEEALVIATCLVMLRRERDRRRFIQAMVIGGMAN
ncbi:hypothetical protein BDV29DRAFT_197661 [Aspergillus leporis]|jgi:hypothetical protein|uniref:Tubby C-terminal-like domain-containing protein n=1 Tax=Aspergillus leporis TaxID=41062 RepID=A0A5N5WR71_9EURO|nr:hypothetical protein BDV29DRAFT_197661 [Aspergillus leporis]